MSIAFQPSTHILYGPVAPLTRPTLPGGTAQAGSGTTGTLNWGGVKMDQHVIGIDLGGTNMRVGLITPQGAIVERASGPTDAASSSGEAIIGRLADLVRTVITDGGLEPQAVCGIGLGIPGPLDPQNGGVKDSPNLGQLDGLPIVARLGAATGLPVLIENDANAAAWGEYWMGAGQGCRSMVMATLGTGIGGGIILDGQLLRGIDHTAAELGHLIVVDGGRPCACGSHGCIEAYASADSTVRRFREEVKRGGGSTLADVPKKALTCAQIFQAAREGDLLALNVVQETGRMLGMMTASIANLLNPERMIFGGGMINAGDMLFDAIKRELKRRAFPVPAARLEVLPAALGGDAGLIGAAGCALTAFATSPS